MNVWIFNQYAADPHRGGSTRHFDCARQLIRNGWDVTLFTGEQHRASDEKAVPWYRAETIDGVRFLRVRIRSYYANDFRRAINILQYSVQAFRAAQSILTRRTIPRPDVVVGSSVHPLAAVVARAIARRANAGFVLELRDLWPQSLIDIGALHPRHPLALALRLLERWLVRRADRIIVLCDKTRQYLVEQGTSPERIAVIPNGVDLEAFGDSVSPVAPRGALVALYLGAHGVANRLDILLDAALDLKRDGVDKIHIEFVGDGPEKDRLMQKAKVLGLTNVGFRSRVPKEAVADTLAQADVLLLIEANNTYGSSNKLGDYLAAGRPIVFSTFASHNIVDECGFAVAPEDARGLAVALTALEAMTPEERDLLGQRARSHAERYHSWVSLVEDYETILTAAADSRATRVH